MNVVADIAGIVLGGLSAGIVLFILDRSSIGYFIVSAQRSFKVREMFGGVFTLAVLGYVLNSVGSFHQNCVLAWHYGYTQQRS